MKNIYDILNHAKVNSEDYDVTPLNDIEKESMKQNFHHTIAQKKRKSQYRYAAVAACLLCVIGFSQTAYAKEVLNNIIQTITIGQSKVIQIDPKSKQHSEQFTDNVGSRQSKFYDKDGKPINEITNNTVLYDKDGKKIGIASKTGNQFCIVDSDTDSDVTEETDLSKAVSLLSFQAKLPKELPNGYHFTHATLYTHRNGKADGNYITLEYVKGNDNITIIERRNSAETTGTLTTDGSVEKIEVKGHEAALVDGEAVEWEADGVNVLLICKTLDRDGLLKLAESFS
jgi:hypothetical protein